MSPFWESVLGAGEVVSCGMYRGGDDYKSPQPPIPLINIHFLKNNYKAPKIPVFILNMIVDQ